MWLNRRSLAGIVGAVASFGAAWLLIGTIAGTGHDVFGRLSSGAPLVPAIKAAMAKLPADTPFYSVGELDHTMPFYLGHTMIMVQQPDELEFGGPTNRRSGCRPSTSGSSAGTRTATLSR